jgi:site-specific DNA recombinase
MGPTFTKKGGKLYRYYLCVHASKNGYDSCPTRTLAAAEIEQAVVDQLRGILRSPEVVAKTYRAARAQVDERRAGLAKAQEEAEKRLQVLREEAARAMVADASTDAPSTASLRLGELQAQMEEQERIRVRAVDEIRRLEEATVTERDVVDALSRLDPVWDELFPDEQKRIVQLLVERVEVHPEGAEVRIRSDGLTSLVLELREEEAVTVQEVVS